MSKDEPSNIFEEAAKMVGRGKKKKRRKRPSVGKKASHGAAPIPDAGEGLEFLGDEAFARRYKDIVEKYSETRDFVSKVYEALGQNSGEVETYLHNPSNFDEDSWQYLQERKEQVAKELFGEGETRVKKAVTQRSTRTKSKKRRKGKFLGARKGWLKTD